MKLSMMNLVLGSALLIVSTSAFSETKKDDGVSAAELAHIAKSVALIGLDSKDPVLIAAAATLQKQAEAARQETTFEADETNTGKIETTKPATFQFTSDNLFSEAKKYAQGLTLSDAIERAKNTKSRGAVGGGKTSTTSVDSNSSDYFRVAFRANSVAKIFADGDGDTDLDLYVRDQNGNTICKDIDSTDTMYCEWTPSWTGVFTIEIKNLGSVYNEYRIVTN